MQPAVVNEIDRIIIAKRVELIVNVWSQDGAYESISDRIIYLLHQYGDVEGFRVVFDREQSKLYDKKTNAYGISLAFSVFTREESQVMSLLIDHGDLQGLSDDDHIQYHNDSRADTWLGTKSIDDLGTKTHSLLSGLLSDDHTQYFLADGTRDLSGNLIPNANGTLTIGDETDYFKTIYLNNNNGKVIDCPTAVGKTAQTDYTFDLGGGGNDATEGGNFTFQMDACVGDCENNIIFDLGDVYWAGANYFNRFKIQSFTGLRTYAFVAAFGGFNNSNYGWELQYISGSGNTAKTLFLDNQTASGLARSIDFRIDSVNKLTVENNGTVAVADLLTTPELTATMINSGFHISTGHSVSSYSNFFNLGWFDFLTFSALTTNLGIAVGSIPNGTATTGLFNAYNSSNAGATAWLSMGVRGAISELVVRDFSQTTDVTDLNIGSGGNDFPVFDVSCTTLTDINLMFAGTTYYNFTSSLLTFSDAVDIAFNTTTGTKIGTATNQKLGFFNATPVTQRLKANYNNWAAFTDIIDALVDLGLFDQA